MNRDQISEAMEQIDDTYIHEASNPRPKRKYQWLAPIAAVLAAAILLSTITAPPSVQASTITAEYPQMAQYPIDPESPDYSSDLTAWSNHLWSQRNQATGYANGLDSFWSSAIPVFLSGEANENYVFSPLNLYMALAMLSETAGGESRKQLLNLLGSDSIDSLRNQAGHVWNAHYLDDGVNATVLANSLWLDNRVTYHESVLNILAKEYYASSFQGDLGSSEMNEALQNWLNEQTGGLLEEQIKNVELNADTVMALASTIYFRTKWASEFHQETEDVFHTPAGETTAAFMQKTMPHHTYYWGEDFSAVRLTLEDGSSMWLFLPDDGKAPSDLLGSGEALNLALSGETQNSKNLTIHLSLPKFDIVSDLDLKAKLQELGITDIFHPESADFSPAISSPEDIYLSTAKHTTRVTIDEEGIEAASYTVFVIDRALALAPDAEEIHFTLDRPFLFMITSHDNLPLFAGVVNQP